MLAEFGSVVEGVRCAVEIQDALKTRNDALPERTGMLFRIGINLGEVVVKGDDLLGDGVNVAARLQSIAPPGGILVSSSSTTRSPASSTSASRTWASRVKNICAPSGVYRLRRGGPVLGAIAPGDGGRTMRVGIAVFRSSSS